MCVKEELESVDYFTVGETPIIDVDVPWTPPDNKYMRCMNAWKTRPSVFSVVGKTARTVNLLEFFDWMDEQKLKTQVRAAPNGVRSAASNGDRPMGATSPSG
uniref:Uncharacterized protein n=3 Tax=Lygus hesperus TaxID=30085 RepID=A0A0K8S6T0_LYGHE